MTTAPLATAKATLSAVVDRIEDTHERVVITRNGVPAAVVISPADLASLEETLDVLSYEAAMKRLAEARREQDRGGAARAGSRRSRCRRAHHR